MLATSAVHVFTNCLSLVGAGRQGVQGASGAEVTAQQRRSSADDGKAAPAAKRWHDNGAAQYGSAGK
jgi:hypothetical protein